MADDAFTPSRRAVAALGRTGGNTSLFAGIDLGSTGVKMLVVDTSGAEICSHQVPTPWRSGPGGTTEMTASDLLAALQTLLTMTAAALDTTDHGAGVVAIGIAGMGETGMLIDATGEAVAPGFAWFDPRGAAEVAAFPERVRADFAGRTGLPLGVQATAVKLAHLRTGGLSLEGLRWLSLPEYVAAALGGEVASEYSLASRTGLLDQDTGRAWPEMLDALGVDASILPPLRDAGSSWGVAEGPLAGPFAGALLTVAGHDHLVAAEASGSLDGDGYHVSIGTAEVLLRVLEAPLGFDARRRLADALINEVRHVRPGTHVLVAGVKTGLLLRRALRAAGITDRAGRDELDAAIMALPAVGALPDGSIEVTGARNDDGVLRLTLHTDGATPAEIVAAVLQHSNDEIALLIDAMDREVTPATRATLTGGWAGMAAVARARARVLPDLSVSPREEETAFGAALAAARLADAPSEPHHAAERHPIPTRRQPEENP